VTAAFSGELQRYRIDDCCGGVLGAHAGAFELGGSLYYGSPSAGYVARNTNVLLDGTFYHADNDGRLSVVDTGGNYSMWAKAQGYTSSTNYLILINCSDHLVGVYYGDYMNWTCIQMYACGNGKDSTPTVKGSFTVSGKGYSFGSGYTCYYYTQFYGDYLLHSILYYQNSWTVMGRSPWHGGKPWVRASCRRERRVDLRQHPLGHEGHLLLDIDDRQDIVEGNSRDCADSPLAFSK